MALLDMTFDILENETKPRQRKDEEVLSHWEKSEPTYQDINWPFLSSRTDETQEKEWGFLEQATKKQSTVEFTQAYQVINWDSQSSDRFITGIQLALQVEAHIIARKLAERGVIMYPENENIQKYAKILEPPKVLGTTPAHKNTKLNNSWLHSDAAKEYKSRWVALEAGIVLVSGNSFKEVRVQLENIKGILITRVY